MHNKPKRPKISGFYLMIVNNYKVTIIPNNSLSSEHPTVVAQAKIQAKGQILVAIPFRLAHMYSPQMCMPYIKYCKRQ